MFLDEIIVSMRSPSKSTQRVLHRLRAGGRRVTVQRRAVLQALQALGCATDAEAVHARARRIYPRLGLVTVYRTLEAFVEEGLVHPVIFGDGRSRYDLTEQGRHHHHQICVSCGRVERLDDCLLTTRGTRRGRRGFTVTAHRLELFGYCARCRADARAVRP